MDNFVRVSGEKGCHASALITSHRTLLNKFEADKINKSTYAAKCLTKGLFTWKGDDPSATIIVEGSFDLHAKMQLLG